MERCIIKIFEKPIHPSKHYEQAWQDSKYWVGSFLYDKYITFLQWKKSIMISYDYNLSFYNYNGFYVKVIPYLTGMESRPDFISKLLD